MVSVAEGAIIAGEAQALKERQAELAKAKPQMSLLHHIASTQAMRLGFTITLVDGSAYKSDKGDFMFTDGLSIVIDDHRIYIPLTAIKAIRVNNPAEVM